VTRFLPAALAGLALLGSAAAAHAQGAPMFGGFLGNTNDTIEVTADALEWTQRNGAQLLVYTGGADGRVSARRGGMEIRAATLTLHLPPSGAANRGAFDRIEASGNVLITAGNQSATANAAVMDMVAQTVVMTGNVSVRDGQSQMSGQRLTINLASGGWRLDTTGNERVITVINPQER
jgi:lipopolysaccharide export system protein LptA